MRKRLEQIVARIKEYNNRHMDNPILYHTATHAPLYPFGFIMRTCFIAAFAASLPQSCIPEDGVSRAIYEELREHRTAAFVTGTTILVPGLTVIGYRYGRYYSHKKQKKASQ